MSHWIVTACALACLFGCINSIPPVPYHGPGVHYAGGDGPGQGRHIVFVAGDEEYRSGTKHCDFGATCVQPGRGKLYKRSTFERTKCDEEYRSSVTLG